MYVLLMLMQKNKIVYEKPNSNYFGIIIKKMPKTCVLLEILHPPSDTNNQRQEINDHTKGRFCNFYFI